jgi:L-ribulose-5-phosphate 3-epimerase
MSFRIHFSGAKGDVNPPGFPHDAIFTCALFGRILPFADTRAFRGVFMFRITRRDFLGSAAAIGLGSHLGWAKAPRLRIGVTDWNLRLAANPDALPLAAKLGFDGLQMSFGRKIVDNRMPADDSEVIARYLSLSQEHRIPIDGTCVDRLHDNCLMSDPLAAKWVSDSIRLTKALKSRVLLVPFFGRCALKTQDEMDRVGDALRELAPEAEKAGVILGLENTVSAEDNVRMMDRSRSPNVLVFYDVGNSTLAGFDVVKEIRWLGKDRICQFHLKDNPHYLGEGQIQFAPILQAIREIGFSGFANLETDAHPDRVEEDMRRNLAFIRNLMSQG